jgi:hypothetical protein
LHALIAALTVLAVGPRVPNPPGLPQSWEQLKSIKMYLQGPKPQADT